MRTFFSTCTRVLRDVCYGIDAGHAIRHGVAPAPRPSGTAGVTKR